eukprot:3272312-Rhodomonas_salina.2
MPAHSQCLPALTLLQKAVDTPTSAGLFVSMSMETTVTSRWRPHAKSHTPPTSTVTGQYVAHKTVVINNTIPLLQFSVSDCRDDAATNPQQKSTAKRAALTTRNSGLSRSHDPPSNINTADRHSCSAATARLGVTNAHANTLGRDTGVYARADGTTASSSTPAATSATRFGAGAMNRTDKTKQNHTHAIKSRGHSFVTLMPRVFLIHQQISAIASSARAPFVAQSVA